MWMENCADCAHQPVRWLFGPRHWIGFLLISCSMWDASMQDVYRLCHQLRSNYRPIQDPPSFAKATAAYICTKTIFELLFKSAEWNNQFDRWFLFFCYLHFRCWRWRLREPNNISMRFYSPRNTHTHTHLQTHAKVIATIRMLNIKHSGWILTVFLDSNCRSGCVFAGTYS